MRKNKGIGGKGPGAAAFDSGIVRPKRSETPVAPEVPQEKREKALEDWVELMRTFIFANFDIYDLDDMPAIELCSADAPLGYDGVTIPAFANTVRIHEGEFLHKSTAHERSENIQLINESTHDKMSEIAKIGDAMKFFADTNQHPALPGILFLFWIISTGIVPSWMKESHRYYLPGFVAYDKRGTPRIVSLMLIDGNVSINFESLNQTLGLYSAEWDESILLYKQP